MAVTADAITLFGDVENLYIRVNSVYTAGKVVDSSTVMVTALYRGFSSRAAAEGNHHPKWELESTFVANVGGNMWEQAYAHLKAEYEGEEPATGETVKISNIEDVEAES